MQHAMLKFVFHYSQQLLKEKTNLSTDKNEAHASPAQLDAYVKK